jgi:predicted nucleic acid-binding protein
MVQRILSVSSSIAQRWGCIKAPDSMPVDDDLQVATALEHGLVLVTRNARVVERWVMYQGHQGGCGGGLSKERA